jgi:hypothetical protein
MAHGKKVGLTRKHCLANGGTWVTHFGGYRFACIYRGVQLSPYGSVGVRFPL